MDITSKWRASVENLRLQNGLSKLSEKHSYKAKSFESYKKILNGMKTLHSFLIANKFKYISSNECHLWSPSLVKSDIDEERFKIDSETKELIKMYRSEIEEESHDFKRITNTNEQRLENCRQIIQYLDSYVNSLLLLFKEIQTQVNLKNPSFYDYTTITKRRKAKLKAEYFFDIKKNTTSISDNTIDNKISPTHSTPPPFNLNLSEQQQSILMEENSKLVDKLETWSSQLNEVQKQILFLTEATGLMADHVGSQAESIEHMLTQAEETRETFGRGNNNIQKAKSSSSDFRLCTLVLLIFLSFSLLFLHWIY